ncbi:MAG: ABC transporter permease subunit [Candidatus Sumerlaeota bacterium]|nr:ABC transporter permease subunit [Candidatus Sumerlaeota bacterium]
MLREICPVYKREMKAYFSSPAIYVALGLFLAFVGLQYHYIIKYFVMVSQQKMMSQEGMYGGMPPINLTEIVVGSMFGLINFLMLLVVPIFTMRLFSEEKRLGTFELLVTCPLRDWSILLGKYLAALTVGLITLAFCLVYPITTQYISGGQAENSVILVSYLGLVLVVAAYVAFGVFASSVTENQMLSAILTFVGLLSFYLVGRMDYGKGAMLFGKVEWADIFSALCAYTHSEPFSKGMLALPDVAFFLMFTVFFLIITAKILEARRWRV